MRNHSGDDDEKQTPGGPLRLYVEADLGAGVEVALAAGPAHYLMHVMRAQRGDRLALFNGRDGEWRAAIIASGKDRVTLAVEDLRAAQTAVPDIWLLLAPVKRTPFDYIVQKATELGARVLQPVMTARTIVARVNMDRLRANAVEAAEQCGRLCVPETRAPIALSSLLKHWDPSRKILFCDEAGDARPIAPALSAERPGPWAILTGPEGGFTPDERQAIRSHSCVLPVTLGPRIMRADTASLAALAVWQSTLGDWM